MKNKSEVVQQFEQFEKERLNNHLSALESRYENEPVSSGEMVAEAYIAPQKIYGKELEDKINSLPEDENDDPAKSQLEKLRYTFFNKMNIAK